MNELEEIMDNLLNVDIEIIDTVRELHDKCWDSESSKDKIGDLLKIRDDIFEQLMSLKDK